MRNHFHGSNAASRTAAPGLLLTGTEPVWPSLDRRDASQKDVQPVTDAIRSRDWANVSTLSSSAYLNSGSTTEKNKGPLLTSTSVTAGVWADKQNGVGHVPVATGSRIIGEV
jgi:hypothetical protein